MLFRSVVRLLRSEDCKVIEAVTARAALEVLRSDAQIDLLFSDLVLPGGMDGLELVEKAKRLRPDLKVLLTTGYVDAAASLPGGAYAPKVLHKPYQLDQLLEALEEVWERS